MGESRSKSKAVRLPISEIIFNCNDSCLKKANSFMRPDVIHSRLITSRYPIVTRFEFLSNFVLYTSSTLNSKCKVFFSVNSNYCCALNSIVYSNFNVSARLAHKVYLVLKYIC